MLDPSDPFLEPAAADETAVVLFSGGQDSTVCLAWALQRFSGVATVGFDYGQRHAIELSTRLDVLARLRQGFPGWAARLGADHVVDLRGFGALAESALTAPQAIALDARGLPTTYVPGRNLVFLATAAALADRIGATALVGGMGEADYSGYPDCRRATLDAMEQALRLGMERPFRIVTPLMRASKARIWRMADALGGAPFLTLVREATHTCYRGERGVLHGWGYGCGACPACDLRARGWAEWRAEEARGPARASVP